MHREPMKGKTPNGEEMRQKMPRVKGPRNAVNNCWHET